MKNVMYNIDAHPMLNFFISVFLLITGKMIKVFALLNVGAIHIPPVIIESMQCVAYAGGGLAGFVAFHGWWHKRKKK